MASPAPPSNLDPRTQSFPVLTPTQIDRLRTIGHTRTRERGEILFEPSENEVPFFVVLSGSMEIVQPTLEGERHLVNHAAGQFTGEMSMISGQRSLARGRVTETGEFLEIPNQEMRSMIGKDAELGEIVMRAFILRRISLVNSGFGNVVILGSRHSAQTLELREFLSRNGHPHGYVDLDTDRDSQELLDRFHVKASDVPIVICHGTRVLRRPSIQELANCLGFNDSIQSSQLRDLIVVGAGPAGLSAAVYAASEGLDVLVIEEHAPGGQAGSSSRIENYLGFPTGISGQELAARATNQAQKFGAHMMIARTVVRLHSQRRPYEIELDTGERLRTRAVVIATGARYNKLPLDNLSRFEGNGVYYGATYMESQLCGPSEVAVVGGGNSAGQAAVFLSQTAGRVHMLVRSNDLSNTMSRYLVQRILENPRIDLHLNTSVTALAGNGNLERITWQDGKTGEAVTRDVPFLFIMTGASPRTDWLEGCVAMDAKGFILTGHELRATDGALWKLTRDPAMLETSLPGVFAVGDVRAGNVKRVASAVGEGSISIHMVHRVLAGL